MLQYYLFPAQVTYNVHFLTSRYLKNINQNEDISSDISIVFLGVLSLLWYVNISMQLPKIEKKNFINTSMLKFSEKDNIRQKCVFSDNDLSQYLYI